MLTRPSVIWPLGAAALVLSFFTTLHLTDPGKPRSQRIESVARAAISDAATLVAAVKAAGLKGAPDTIKGGIEGIRRISAGRVELKGWAAEIGNKGTPLTVMAFTNGINVFSAQTKGARPEVTRVLGLADTDAENVAFEGILSCTGGQKLIVVAVSRAAVYSQFGILRCP